MSTGGVSGGQSAGPAADGDVVIFDLRLYVAGQSPKSIRAIENLRRVCDEHLPGRYRIEVIDLMQNPELARGDGIIAVPTLVCRVPLRFAPSSVTCPTGSSSGCNSGRTGRDRGDRPRRGPAVVADPRRRCR